MDIWDWVHTEYDKLVDSGNQRLADAIDDLPSLACADQHEKLDLLYPEALNLAKKWNNPWVEVFVRHWNLQSQVLHRHNVKGMLAEAIDLLEFSSREETKDCPQSICVVQDLANCYANKDGPSYVQERLDVSTETLSRINARWPCYDCIAAEEISAFIDDKQYDKAIERIQFHREEMTKVGAKSEKIPFALSEIQIHMENERYQEAEKVAREAENPYAGESFLRYKSAAIALALAYQGKFQEAEQHEVPFTEAISAQSHFLDWCELNYLKAKHEPTKNNQDLNYCFNRMVTKYIDHGVQRDTLKVLNWQIELAFLRNDLFTVEQCLKSANAIIPELAKDFGARANFDGLSELYQEKISQIKNEIDLSTETIHRTIENNELELSRLKLACSSYPKDNLINTAYFDLLVENGYIEEALIVANEHLKHAGVYGPLLSRLGNLLLDESQFETFDQLLNTDFVDSLDEESKPYAQFVLANRYETTDPKKSLEFIRQVIEANPSSENSLRKAAKLTLSLELWPESVKYWDHLINLDEENKHFHWDRMVPATLSNDWESVRESSKVLNIEIEGETGPIDQDMGSCRIQILDESGSKVNLAAKRVGPVEAEITAIRNLEEEQFFGARVVFDAAPLNQLDREDEEGYKCDSEGYYNYLYPLTHIKQSNPHFYFSVDGVYPGDEQWKELEKLFIEFDLAWSVRSSDEYQVQKNESGPKLDAIYFYLACPESCNLQDLNQRLSALISSFEHPLIWPQLAAKLEDKTLLEQQSETEEIYALY